NIGVQGAALLHECHHLESPLYYWDCKLEHGMFWPEGITSGAFRMIDWNSCKRPVGGNVDDFDRDQFKLSDIQRFSCRVLYPLFTGQTVSGKAVSSFTGNVGPIEPRMRHGT